jgi:hypothetical protein
MATRTSKTNSKKSGNGKQVETKVSEAKAAAPKTARKPAAKKAGKAVKADKAVKAPKAATPELTLEERWEMIRTAAYFLAESDGFSGDPEGYWIAAERQLSSYK